ncbi:MAG: hypothetical protein HC811_09930 [Flammeovirgaceae bacterium]|nr:hypothetical protein [Flammeovirgaceae bacterium]
MIRILVVWFGLFLLFSACTEQLICPAYQSAYIYDKEELRKKFSYFKEDSTPKVYAVNKNKYLVAVPESYRKKLRSLQTVEMKPVNVVVPDSFTIEKSPDAMLADRDMIDSTAVSQSTAIPGDSTYVISVDKEVRVLKYDKPDTVTIDYQENKLIYDKPKYYVDEVGFNSDQDIYMWYFRDILVLPDARARMEENGTAKPNSAKGKEKKSGGLFSNLFKKKNPSDSLTTENNSKPKKKKKEKKSKKQKEPEVDPAKKVEEDDGF